VVKHVVEVLHLFVSPGHNFFGHHGRPAGRHPVHELPEARCAAGRGIVGDRFFLHEPNHKGQITFFADEVYQSLCEEFGIWDKPPSVFRRNIITRGVDLSQLIGREFELQGLRFFGMEECRPCHWMNQAFCPGAEIAMRGHGGLRARILTTGVLRVTVRPRLNAAAAPPIPGCLAG
jgi:MOSC domain-containing protein YiiM